jgi:hypothetical protein
MASFCSAGEAGRNDGMLVKRYASATGKTPPTDKDLRLIPANAR